MKVMAVRKLVEKSAVGEPDLKLLREFCQDVVALRRGDHSAARLRWSRNGRSGSAKKPGRRSSPISSAG